MAIKNSSLLNHSNLRKVKKPLDRYFKEVERYPLLSPEEEKKLAARARKGDKEARDKLILGNLRWVVTIAKQYQKRGLDLMQLINEGNAGLIEAAQKYDERKNVRFTTYSHWWIRYYMLSALINRNLIKLPVKYRKLAKKIRDSYPMIAQKLKREPSIEEIAKTLNIGTEDVSKAFHCDVGELSIEAPMSEKGIIRKEVMEDISILSPDESFAKKILEKSLAEKVEKELLPRERYVVLRNFGIPLTKKKYGIEEIAEMIDKPQELVKDKLLTTTKKILKKLGESPREDITEKTLDSLSPLIAEKKEKVMKLVREFPLLECEIFSIYFGISQDEPLNLREIGDLLGITREASRQIKNKALRRLKTLLSSHSFDFYFRRG